MTKIAPQASSREAEGLMIRHQGFLAEAEGKRVHILSNGCHFTILGKVYVYGKRVVPQET